MTVPALLGRRIQIAGSIATDPAVATADAVQCARMLVKELVVALIKDGALFVVPVDADHKRPADGLPICFDWLVLKTIDENLRWRPAEAARDERPLLVAVQHHKNESQIPEEYRECWDQLKETDGLLVIENAGRWNMNSKRMDIQAAHGDILLTLGGDEGVLYLANLYHDTGKPVVPLNLPVTPEGRGSLRLWETALSSSETQRFFRTADGSSSHHLLNRLNFVPSTPTDKQVNSIRQLLHNLRRPVAFAVRLLNRDHDDFKQVEDFFSGVVMPTAEEFGYDLKVVDGSVSEESIVNQEIFKSLYYSSLVVADVTGLRPNCFIELGFALRGGRPVMVCARKNTPLPFDIEPVPTHHWDPQLTLPRQQEEFRKYWNANINRRPIVQPDALVLP